MGEYLILDKMFYSLLSKEEKMSPSYFPIFFLMEFVEEAFIRNIIIVLYLNYTGLFISPSGISELDCATTKTDTGERSISIGREYLQVFFVLGALAYFQVSPLGGSRD